MLSKYELRDMILCGEDISRIDYSHITDMSHMFVGRRELIEVPFIDTSNVSDFRGMFRDCNNLKTVQHFNLSKAKDFTFMFFSCFELESTFDSWEITRDSKLRHIFNNNVQFFELFGYSRSIDILLERGFINEFVHKTLLNTKNSDLVLNKLSILLNN